MPRGELENGTSALDIVPDFDWGKWVAQAITVPAGVIDEALQPPVLNCCAGTSITVPDLDVLPVSGLLRRSFLSESVSKPSWEIRHPQHSVIC